MLRHRVIPIVLLDGYSVVKTIKFEIRRNLGNPIVVSRVYNSRNVDELILLDIDASKEGRAIDLHTVSLVADECFMPLTVGGGLKSCDDIAKVLESGADKVSLNSVIFDNPSFCREAVSVFGSQCIIASVDIKKDPSGNYVLYSHSGRSISMLFEEYIEFLNNCRIGEILLNNVDSDGLMDGYDFELISKMAKLTNIPLIVAGGASGPQDCTKAINSGAAAAAAASIFHFTSITPRDCKKSMFESGIPVRI